MYFLTGFIVGIVLGIVLRSIKFKHELNVSEYCEGYMAKQLKSYILQINKGIKKAQDDKVLYVNHIKDNDYRDLLKHIYLKQGYTVENNDTAYWNGNGLKISWDKYLGGKDAD